MPIYIYHCSRCDEDTEILHSMDELGVPRIHQRCGSPMERLVAPCSFCIPETNKDRALRTLNGEVPLPTTPEDRPRMEKAFAKGLNHTRPVIGRGF